MKKSLLKIIATLFLVSMMSLCVGCDFLPPLGSHDWESTYSYNSEYHWYNCKDCEAQFGKQLHNFVNNVCADCQYEQHLCSFTEEVEEERYEKTKGNCITYGVYYKSCECGEMGEETFVGKTYGAHTYGDWEDEKPATEESSGVKGHYTCSVCHNDFDVQNNKLDNLVIPPIAHICVFDKEVADSDYLKAVANCQSPALYYLSCKCGLAGENTFAFGDVGGHSVSEKYSYNAEVHYNACMVNGCDYKENQESHTFVSQVCECGCKENVIAISSAEQLKAINPNKNYVLLNDIDLNGTAWTPIAEFNGTIEGNGFAISNFTINLDVIVEDNRSTDLGLIIKNYGVISNLKIVNVSITVKKTISDILYNSQELTRIGVIATENHGTIKNCEVSGLIKVKNEAVFVTDVEIGFIASKNEGVISGCKAQGSADIEAIATGYTNYNPTAMIEVGGIVSSNATTAEKSLFNCCSSVKIVAYAKASSSKGSGSTNVYAGGIVAISSSAIDSCYATGDISVNTYSRSTSSASNSTCYVGGLAGYSSGAEKSYSTGNVSLNSDVSGSSTTKAYCYAGGLIGYSTALVKNCYSTSNVNSKASVSNTSTTSSAYSYAGGISGYATANIESCYALGDVNSKAESSGNKSGNWAQAFAGGITTGYMNEGSVKNSFFSGKLTTEGVVDTNSASAYVRAFAIAQPVVSNSIANCYRASEQEVSNKSVTANRPSENANVSDSASVTAKIESEYKTANFWFNTLNFSADVWEFNSNGYATLKI